MSCSSCSPSDCFNSCTRKEEPEPSSGSSQIHSFGLSGFSSGPHSRGTKDSDGSKKKNSPDDIYGKFNSSQMPTRKASSEKLNSNDNVNGGSKTLLNQDRTIGRTTATLGPTSDKLEPVDENQNIQAEAQPRSSLKEFTKDHENNNDNLDAEAALIHDRGERFKKDSQQQQRRRSTDLRSVRSLKSTGKPPISDINATGLWHSSGFESAVSNFVSAQSQDFTKEPSHRKSMTDREEVQKDLNGNGTNNLKVNNDNVDNPKAKPLSGPVITSEQKPKSKSEGTTNYDKFNAKKPPPVKNAPESKPKPPPESKSTNSKLKNPQPSKPNDKAEATVTPAGRGTIQVTDLPKEPQLPRASEIVFQDDLAFMQAPIHGLDRFIFRIRGCVTRSRTLAFADSKGFLPKSYFQKFGGEDVLNNRHSLSRRRSTKSLQKQISSGPAIPVHLSAYLGAMKECASWMLNNFGPQAGGEQMKKKIGIMEKTLDALEEEWRKGNSKDKSKNLNKAPGGKTKLNIFTNPPPVWTTRDVFALEKKQKRALPNDKNDDWPEGGAVRAMNRFAHMIDFFCEFSKKLQIEYKKGNKSQFNLNQIVIHGYVQSSFARSHGWLTQQSVKTAMRLAPLSDAKTMVEKHAKAKPGGGEGRIRGNG